jgi:molybdate transport system permease protein
MTLSDIDLPSILAVTLRVAALATVLAAIPAVPLALLLARHEFPGRGLLNATLNLPLVLPPVVIGYLLLVLLSREGPAGTLLHDLFGVRLIFTWIAAALAAAVIAFPLMLGACASPSRGWIRASRRRRARSESRRCACSGG